MGLKHISHRRQQYATPTYPSPETYLLRTMLFLLPSKDFRPFTFCSGFDGQNQNLITGRSNFMAQYCCSLPSPPSNDQKNSHTNGPNLITKVKMMVFHQGGQCEAVSSPAEEGCDHQLTLQMGEATPKQCLGRYKGPLYLSSPIICFIAIKKSPLLCSVHGHGRLLASPEGVGSQGNVPSSICDPGMASCNFCLSSVWKKMDFSIPQSFPSSHQAVQLDHPSPTFTLNQRSRETVTYPAEFQRC